MSLQGMVACAGAWSGTSTLQDPERDTAQESVSMATVTPILDGRFVRLDYTWSHKGKGKEGSLLLGFDPRTARCSAYWIDSWHLGPATMTLKGRFENSIFSVKGVYPAQPGPDWEWRILIAADPAGEIRVTMFNISPHGQEELAVEAVYTRADV